MAAGYEVAQQGEQGLVMRRRLPIDQSESDEHT
jgi:hypothetical protein